MSHNEPQKIRRVYGGLTQKELATLPPDILAARAQHLAETDAELRDLEAMFPPKWMPRAWFEADGSDAGVFKYAKSL